MFWCGPAIKMIDISVGAYQIGGSEKIPIISC
jgi:hypothetical protein